MLLRAPESLTSAFGGKANQAGATPLSTHTKGRTKWPIQNRAFLDACPSRHRDGRRRQTVHGWPPRACGLAVARTRSLVALSEPKAKVHYWHLADSYRCVIYLSQRFPKCREL